MLKGSSIFGIRWELRGKEKLEQQKDSCIFICNHQSSLDTIGKPIDSLPPFLFYIHFLGMMKMWPDRCVPMMKKELKYAGPFGLAGILTGSVFIDRFSKEKAIETCNETLQYMKEKNVSLSFFWHLGIKV